MAVLGVAALVLDGRPLGALRVQTQRALDVGPPQALDVRLLRVLLLRAGGADP